MIFILASIIPIIYVLAISPKGNSIIQNDDSRGSFSGHLLSFDEKYIMISTWNGFEFKRDNVLYNLLTGDKIHNLGEYAYKFSPDSKSIIILSKRQKIEKPSLAYQNCMGSNCARTFNNLDVSDIYLFDIEGNTTIKISDTQHLFLEKYGKYIIFKHDSIIYSCLVNDSFKTNISGEESLLKARYLSVCSYDKSSKELRTLERAYIDEKEVHNNGIKLSTPRNITEIKTTEKNIRWSFKTIVYKEYMYGGNQIVLKRNRYFPSPLAIMAFTFMNSVPTSLPSESNKLDYMQRYVNGKLVYGGFGFFDSGFIITKSNEAYMVTNSEIIKLKL